ncbi:MAG TPA: DUF4276 family protein [Thermodesulfobacteriota bacterium]|nr:DUF4276 family protein [Thermodesulfobacteriota bacterium]
MHIEFLVEEYSAEVALINILPRILGENTAYAIRTFSGKQDLLTQLPLRLKGYRKWKPEDRRIVVLVDQDRENCLDLKDKLEEAARKAGFITKSGARGRRGFDVINRLAIEELEAWFFGDPKAIVQAYPRVPTTIGSKAPYRNPDAIVGGTWETLERVLQKAGYYPGGMPKAETAENISKYMDPSRNGSKSFQVFRDALLGLHL